MALKHVNAVIVGAGAGGGVVAKELATAGLSVVLLERGQWYTAADCRKDDLRNQRTSPLGNNSGPDEERNPRVAVDLNGKERVVLPSEGGYSNNAACVGGGTFTYGAQAWRFHEKDFRMATTYGVPDGSTLADWPLSYADLEPYYEKAEYEIGVSGDVSADPFHGPRRKPLPMPPRAAESRVRHPQARRPKARPASLRPPHVAQFRALQRTPALHAVPLVRGFRLRGQRQVRHAEYRHPHGARDAATANCAPAAWRAKFSPIARGRVTGVAYYDADDRLREQTADIVIVSSSAIESARLLLNSKSKMHPAGLGNHSDQVGRNLQGHSYSGAWGLFDFDTYDDIGPGASIAISDYNHGNPGLIGGAMLANEFIRLPYQFVGAAPPGTPAVGTRAQRIHAPVVPPQHRHSGTDAGDPHRRFAGHARPQGQGLLGAPRRPPLRRQTSQDQRDRRRHGREGGGVAQGRGRHTHLEKAPGEGNQRRPAPGRHLPHGQRSRGPR